MKLARVTGNPKYMDLSKFFVDERGTEPHFFDEEARRDGRDPNAYIFGSYEYSQSHITVREQKRSSVMRCAPCISIPAWRTWRPNIRTTV